MHTNKNICRHCFKKRKLNFVDKCEGCWSICCYSCKLTKKDNIWKIIYLVGEQHNSHLLCMPQCMDILYNPYKSWIKNVSPHFNKNDNWIPKYIHKQLMNHLITDICNIIVEY